MVREYRISAGGIIIKHDRLLLVRTNNGREGNFLVAPGGGVIGDESIYETAIREVHEETGLVVKPIKILFVEDLLSRQHRIVKIWFLCQHFGGQLKNTPQALEESICEIGWYSREQLQKETVYPTGIMDYDWSEFVINNWETKYLGISRTKY
jgi:8-oxo-dGTP pyrophosphatase MutT (NUDIX family)